MNIRSVLLVLSFIGCIISTAMLVPGVMAWFCGTPDAKVLLSCALLSFAVCAAVVFFTGAGKKRERTVEARAPISKSSSPLNDIGTREAFAIVTFSWILASAIGGLPYVFYGTTTNFTDAFFEAMSGFTTTGASILTDIEVNPHGILLWRAITHWLGGMGIIVLGLTVLTFVGGGGMELFKAESATPLPEKLTPRLKQTALILWGIYVLLSALETTSLMLCGTTFYEAITHTFATVATGGFSIYNDSIAHFHSPSVEWVVTTFSFLSGTNFTLHFLLLRDRTFKPYLEDDEFRWYLCIVIFIVGVVSVAGYYGGLGLSWGTALRQGAFQTVTLLSSTGFAVTDTLQWPYIVHFVLLLALVMGACAGSTSGGLKVLRVVILVRHAKNTLVRALQSHRVTCVRLNNKPLEESVVNSVLAFFVLYMLLWAAVSMFLTALGVDPMSAISGTIACMSNIGPGLGQFGPVGNYAGIPAAGKWALSFAMLTGRLELLTVFALFMPETWRR